MCLMFSLRNHFSLLLSKPNNNNISNHHPISCVMLTNPKGPLLKMCFQLLPCTRTPLSVVSVREREREGARERDEVEKTKRRRNNKLIYFLLEQEVEMTSVFFGCGSKNIIKKDNDSSPVSALLPLSVPSCGCEEAERQSSSLVSRRCGSGAWCTCRTRPHQQAKCKIPLHHLAVCYSVMG